MYKGNNNLDEVKKAIEEEAARQAAEQERNKAFCLDCRIDDDLRLFDTPDGITWLCEDCADARGDIES